MSNKDWIGNKASTWATLGANNHVPYDRAEYDFYATEPKASKLLLDECNVELNINILEPCAGNGHISEVLKSYGYNVVSKDLVQRDYPLDGTWDFLKQNEEWHGDIVTNPPYKYAYDFVNKSLDMIDNGNKVFMFLKLQFLEGKSRRKLFDTKQLKTVYVSTSRLKCAMNGDFNSIVNSAATYAWFEFVKGYNGDTIIKWFN